MTHLSWLLLAFLLYNQKKYVSMFIPIITETMSKLKLQITTKPLDLYTSIITIEIPAFPWFNQDLEFFFLYAGAVWFSNIFVSFLSMLNAQFSRI